MLDFLIKAFNSARNGFYAILTIALALAVLSGGITLISKTIVSRRHWLSKTVITLLLIGVLVAIYYFAIPYIIELMRGANWVG